MRRLAGKILQLLCLGPSAGAVDSSVDHEQARDAPGSPKESEGLLDHSRLHEHDSI